MAQGPLIPYIRQSRAKEKTISVEEQRRAIQAWAEHTGVKLAADVVEQGVSGSTHWKARGLGEAVRACERGAAAGIIVAFQDRLSREHGLGTAEVWDALDKAHARLVCAAEGLDTATGDQEMLFSIKAAIARDQWKRYRANWRSARQNAVERGVHPSRFVPVGFAKNERQPRVPGMIGAFNNPARLELTAEERWADPVVGQLVPNEHADAIRALFELRASGVSWSECCQLLDERISREDGWGWLLTTVQAIIRNPVYKGEAFLRSQGRQDGDIVNVDAHEPIVDTLLWKAAQATRGKPRRTSQAALLSGVLRCACCGRRLTPSTGRYRCRPRMVLGAPCDAPANVRADEVEALVTRGFLGAVAYRPAAPSPPDLEPYERAVTVALAAVAKWQEAAIAGTVEPDAFAPAIAARKSELEAAEAALFEAREAAGLLHDHLTLIERWGTMTVLERRRALRSFEVTAYVERGRQPVHERVTIEMRGAPVGDGWEPDVEYTLPSDQELAEQIRAEYAAAGIGVKNVAARIAAWKAKYADAKIVITPIVLSTADKAAADAIFGLPA